MPATENENLDSPAILLNMFADIPAPKNRLMKAHVVKLRMAFLWELFVRFLVLDHRRHMTAGQRAMAVAMI